jgi:hypothetical protein
MKGGGGFTYRMSMQMATRSWNRLRIRMSRANGVLSCMHIHTHMPGWSAAVRVPLGEAAIVEALQFDTNKPVKLHLIPRPGSGVAECECAGGKGGGARQLQHRDWESPVAYHVLDM